MLLTALLVPLAGALLVAATFVVSSRVSRRIGVASALVTAFSPVFLHQLIQSTSDVPAGGLWMLAVAFVTGAERRGAALGGLAAGVALLVRPHLAPLALPLGLFLLLRPERPWRHRLGAAATFAACVVPSAIGAAAIQLSLYGSPLSSGYGPLGPLFSLDHVGPNAVRYASWLTGTQTPVWVLAAAAPLLLPGALTRLLLGLFLVNVACY
ncbi:MAG: glycosyltransferase family 39 protein, partial [Acidobacteria bacterium]|nr:glycosyltransferase family 39 protein [Acidobacteriota bacterium]